MNSPEQFEVGQEIADEMLVEAMKDWENLQSCELITRWKLAEEAKSDKINSGPDRGKGRVLVSLKMAKLLLEAGQRDMAQIYFEETLESAEQEGHNDLVEEIRAILSQIVGNEESR